jgi:hypothetical protein
MACLWREQPVGPQFFMTSAQRRSMARSHRSYRRMASASGGLSPAVDAGEFGHDVVQLDDDFGVGHPAVSHTLEVGGVPAASCLGGSGSSEGCSSAWFPAARSAGTTNGFQEHLWFATCRCCLSASLALRDGSQARSSRVYPVPGLVRRAAAAEPAGDSYCCSLARAAPGPGRRGRRTAIFLTESVDRVIGASRGHLGYRQARPVRELSAISRPTTGAPISISAGIIFWFGMGTFSWRTAHHLLADLLPDGKVIGHQGIVPWARGARPMPLSARPRLPHRRGILASGCRV